MLKPDLHDAKIPYVDDSGRYANFHSLRHTTGSLLVACGAHPKIAQSLMRHSDINLTMKRYSHVFKGQESEAVEALPDLSQSSINTQKSLATGTDGSAGVVEEIAYKPAYKKLTKKPYFDCDPLSSVGNNIEQEKSCAEQKIEPDNSLQMADLRTEKELVSSNGIDEKTTGPTWIRTKDQWIMSPLLYR